MTKKKQAPTEPSNKIKLTLYFDTKAGRKNFQAWYLDGGGGQDSHYHSTKWADEWMYLTPPGNACPECECGADEDGINGFFYDNRETRCKKFTCNNCGQEYLVDNPYS